MKNAALAYWLIPDGAAGEFFAATIQSLARKFDAPTFDPHVTLFVAPENSRDPSQVIRESGTVNISLEATGVNSGNEFTKTLFVQFEESDALQHLADAIFTLSGARLRHVIDPHLSLLYKNVSSAAARDLAAAINLPFSAVRFSSVRAVRCALPTTNARDVAEWRTVA